MQLLVIGLATSSALSWLADELTGSNFRFLSIESVDAFISGTSPKQRWTDIGERDS